MSCRPRLGFALALAGILALGFFTRGAGLMRGLDRGIETHPDASKQVLALENYLNGTKVWYFGSLFFDGYPYGLNVVDMFLIKGVSAVVHPIIAYTNPTDGELTTPTRPALYYWARGLRVLYGLAALLMTILLARRLTGSRAAALLVGLAAAIHPLSTTVSHFATGDIGIDLFLLAMACALALSRDRPRTVAVVLAGGCCGIAFGCKFQGALGLVAVGSFLALATPLSPRPLARAAVRGLLAGAAAVLGAYLVTPAFHVAPETAWTNMWRNFLFVKDYGTSAEHLAEPTLHKLHVGLCTSLPIVINAMGWSLTACALIGLAVGARRWWRLRREDSPARTGAALLFALGLFPAFATLVSTALKPTVQPFHFSYIAPFAAVGGGIGLLALYRRGGPARIAAVLLLGATLAELGVRARREQFFWIREDTKVAAVAFAESAFRGEILTLDQHWLAPPERILKVFRAEPSTIPVFRNRSVRVLSPHAPFWQAVRVIPGPTTPMDARSRWVFSDGPVLARDDHAFAIEPAGHAIRDIVLYDPVPPRLTLGLRAGRFPVEVRVQGAGSTQAWQLDPGSQSIVELPTRGGRRFAPAPDGTFGGVILTLRFEAQPGAAWVTVFGNDPRERANFALTGGATNRWDDPALSAWPIADLTARAAEMAFLDGTNAELELTADVQSLMGPDRALPAGRYLLTCEVEAKQARNDLVFQLSDASGWIGRSGTTNQITVGPGLSRVSIPFDKPFAPTEVHMLVACPEGGATVRAWDLRPDTARILDDLRTVREGGPDAAWMHPYPPRVDLSETALSGVVFGSAIELAAVAIPCRLAPGQQVDYNLRFRLRDFGLPKFLGLVVFVHLLDADGVTRAQLDFPLGLACFNDAPMFPAHGALPADLAPGRYRIRVGLYTPGSNERLRVVAPGHAVTSRAVEVGTVDVVAP